MLNSYEFLCFAAHFVPFSTSGIGESPGSTSRRERQARGRTAALEGVAVNGNSSRFDVCG